MHLAFSSQLERMKKKEYLTTKAPSEINRKIGEISEMKRNLDYREISEMKRLERDTKGGNIMEDYSCLQLVISDRHSLQT